MDARVIQGLGEGEEEREKGEMQENFYLAPRRFTFTMVRPPMLKPPASPPAGGAPPKLLLLPCDCSEGCCCGGAPPKGEKPGAPPKEGAAACCGAPNPMLLGAWPNCEAGGS